MNVLNLLTRLYAYTYNRSGIPFWMITPIRKGIRFLADRILPKYLSEGNVLIPKKKVDVVVSFTSFPARINNVWQVVECMKRQSFQPSKILLWLSKEQFPTSDSVPNSLKVREGGLFQIRYVDGDIRSHKKYYYVSRENPDSLIFLIDDDIYYPTNILENTIKTHEMNPNAIICNYGCHIVYSHDGGLLPYNQWRREYGKSNSSDLFFGSGGGTLLQPSKMYKDFLDNDLFLNMTPIADDIWINAMARLAKLPFIMLKNGAILPIFNKRDKKLASENKGQNKNDVQINNIIVYYKEIGLNPFES